MRFLRQNTAVRITVGPFFDKTDGITPETSLTVTNCKLTMMVDDDDNTAANLIIDAAPTASGGDNDMVHVTNDDAGFYDLELTAAQTNYVGRAIIAITDAANHCPVFHEFMIAPANVYDSLFGTDALQVDLVQILGTALTETSGQIAAAFKKLFDVASPVLTAASVNQTGDAYAKVDTEIASMQGDVTAIKAKTDALPAIWCSP